MAPATHLIDLNGGGFLSKYEDTTMTDLIPIASRTIAGHPTETVSAKRLHEFLGIGRDFSNWIKARIGQYGFAENEDYLLVRQNGRTKGRGGATRVANYFVTLDMAKELCMVERNERGREARRYFIECEKQLRKQRQLSLPEPEATLPPDIQKALDERIGYFTGQAHIMIRDRLTRYAHECQQPCSTKSALELFEMWAGQTSTVLLLKQDISHLYGLSKFMAEELTKLSEEIVRL